MNPTCWLVERRLSALVARGASPDRSLLRHLGACPRCRAFHADLISLAAGLGTLAAPRSAPELDTRVLERLATAPSMPAGGAVRSRVAAIALAVTAPAALALVYLSLRPAPVSVLLCGVEPERKTPIASPAPRVVAPTPAPPPVRPQRVARMAVPRSIRRVVSLPPAAKTPIDDLAYVNGERFEAFARRTGELLRRDPDPLLDALPSDHAGDDFVALPPPQLAGVGDAAMADALARYEQERQVVDARLQRAVTVGVKRVSLADLCEQLTKETGITFTASRAVADEKLTLFCTDRPVRDLLRQLNRLMGFVWERTGTEDAWAYRLVEPLKVRLLEEELRNRDRNEALLALDRDMEGYKDLLNLSPEDARALAQGAGSEREKQRLQNLGGIGWGPAQLYQGLSADERDALLSGKALSFGGSAGNPAVPESLRRSILNSLRGHAFVDTEKGGMTFYSNRDSDSARAQKGSAPGDIPGAEPTATLHLQRNELGEFSLTGSTGFTSKGMGGSSGVEIARGVSPSAASPRNGDANAARRNEPAYRRKVTLEATDKKRKLTTADLLEAIHRATGRDVIGDYYTRLYEPDQLLSREATALFDALNRACDPARLRWSDTEKWLTFRSTDFFNMRLKEVPNRLLDRWAAKRAATGALDADQFREISRLTDFQLDAGGMAEGAKILWGLEEWETVRSENLRTAWRFADSLPGSQRAALLGPGGLTFGSLGLDARQQFVRMVFYPGDEIRKSLESGSADPDLLQRLAVATLVLTNDPKRLPRSARLGDGTQRAWCLISRCPVEPGQIRTLVKGPSGSSSSQGPE